MHVSCALSLSLSVSLSLSLLLASYPSLWSWHRLLHGRSHFIWIWPGSLYSALWGWGGGEDLLEDTAFNISQVTGAGVNIVSCEEYDKEQAPLVYASHTTQDVTWERERDRQQAQILGSDSLGQATGNDQTTQVCFFSKKMKKMQVHSVSLWSIYNITIISHQLKIRRAQEQTPRSGARRSRRQKRFWGMITGLVRYKSSVNLKFLWKQKFL